MAGFFVPPESLRCGGPPASGPTSQGKFLRRVQPAPFTAQAHPCAPHTAIHERLAESDRPLANLT